MCGCLLHAPNQGPGLQPRHMLRPGIRLCRPAFNLLNHTSQGHITFLMFVIITNSSKSHTKVSLWKMALFAPKYEENSLIWKWI